MSVSECDCVCDCVCVYIYMCVWMYICVCARVCVLQRGMCATRLQRSQGLEGTSWIGIVGSFHRAHAFLLATAKGISRAFLHFHCGDMHQLAQLHRTGIHPSFSYHLCHSLSLKLTQSHSLCPCAGPGFDFVYLSNVPDYTGLLNLFVHFA